MACTSVLSRFSKPEDVQGLQASPHPEESPTPTRGTCPLTPAPQVVLLTDSERLAAHRAESVELLASTGYEVTSVAYSTAQLFLQRLAELTVDLILVEVRAWTFKSTCLRLIGGGEAGAGRV
jgi:PleD family two-component response regulator